MNRYGGRVQPIETGALPSVDTFSGDDSTTVFALSYEAASDQAVTVLIGGVTQHVDAYSINGTTLTFVEAPVAGTDNIEVRIVSQVGKSTVPQDSSVTPNKTTGMQNVIQELHTDDNVYATYSGVILVDNSIPQISEGSEIMSVNFTPKDASNILLFDFQAMHSIDTGGRYLTAALFKNSDADAIAGAPYYHISAGGIRRVAFKHRMVAGITSTITFSVRAGVSTADGWQVNGNTAGSLIGNIPGQMYLNITEYKP